ncbi:virulence-associated E family protein [Flintibacter muris]|uniref:virulence-associated E family protein n=1 Tax=Flintibacter muris TaxID=2941327 RepID=UPI00204028B3|nr:virulence-associated E family protein [Flintibacter muris]
MRDNISFLVEHGVPLEEIQSLLADGHSLEEITVNARRMVERGESLSTRKQAEPERRVSVESVNTALRELGVTPNAIDGCLSCIADQNRYNPVKTYLTGGTWDGEDRFPEIFRILGVTNFKHQTYIAKWFCQCVALGLNREDNPIGVDGVLVLQGPQGLAKTSFFRIMSPFPRWFVEGAVVDMGSKDSLITALSGWITELGKLDSTLKKEQMSLNALVQPAMISSKSGQILRASSRIN